LNLAFRYHTHYTVFFGGPIMWLTELHLQSDDSTVSLGVVMSTWRMSNFIKWWKLLTHFKPWHKFLKLIFFLYMKITLCICAVFLLKHCLQAVIWLPKYASTGYATGLEADPKQPTSGLFWPNLHPPIPIISDNRGFNVLEYSSMSAMFANTHKVETFATLLCLISYAYLNIVNYALE
jgi:hypothetical protein